MRARSCWITAIALILSAQFPSPLNASSSVDQAEDAEVAAAEAADRGTDPVAAQRAWQALLDREETAGRGSDYLAQRALRQTVYALLRQRRATEALPLAVRALELSRASFGSEADWTMSGAILLADVHRDLGNHAQAIALVEPVVAAKRQRPQSEAVNRHNLAMMLYLAADHHGRANQWDRAVALIGEAIEVERSAGASAQTLAYRATVFSLTLFNAGQREESRQVLAAALPDLRRHYGADNDLTLHHVGWLGHRLVYEANDYPAAVPLLIEACDGWRRRGNSGQLLNCLGALADAHDYQNLESEELPFRRELLDLARRTEGPATPYSMQAAERLVTALGEARDVAGARQLAEETLAMPQVAALPTADRATLLAVVGSIALNQGEIDRAAALFDSIVTALRPLPQRRESLLQAEAQLAVVAYMRGNFLEADAVFRRVLPELRELGGESADMADIFGPTAVIAAARTGQTASAPTALVKAGTTPTDFPGAFAAFAAGNYAAAASGFAAVRADIDQRASATPPDRTIVAMAAYVSVLQAASRHEIGEDDRAESLFRSAIAEMAPIQGPMMAVYRAPAHFGLARVYASRRDYAAAIAEFSTARAIARASDLSDTLFLIAINDELAEAQRNADPATRAPLAVLFDSVRLARQSRDRAALGSDAGGSAVEQALARTTAAQRSQSDPLRQTYADWLDEAAGTPYRALASDGDHQDAVFTVAQDMALSNAGSAMRASAARLSLGSGRAAQLGREQADLAERARAAEARLADLRNGGSEAELAAAAAERTMIGERLAEVDAAIDSEAPDYRLLLRPRAIGLDRFRERLQRGEALLLIAGGGEFATYVVAVTRNRFAWHRIDDTAALEALTSRVRCSLDPTTCAAAGEDTGGLPSFDADAAHRLYLALIAPLGDSFGDANRIFVTASGRLGELPLSVLVTSPPVPGSQPAWYGEGRSFVLLPSVAALRAVRRRREDAMARPRYIAYGAPELAPLPSGAPWNPPPAGLADPAMLRTTYGPLATARREMVEVASALGAPETMVFADRAATETAVRADTMLPTAAVVHFATHGLLPDPRAPAILGEPGLVFTPPATATAADDGVLSASEAATMQFSADWLILSACTTATAGVGDGAAIGDADSLGLLARAFLYAGTRRLVASHWNLSDATGRILVTGMLRTLAEDSALRPSQALAQAQAAIRSGRRADGSAVFGWDRSWQHPFFWASLSMIAYDDDR